VYLTELRPAVTGKSTAEIMCAQYFNFAPKLPQNWVYKPQLLHFWTNISWQKRRFSENFLTAQNFGDWLNSPPLPRGHAWPLPPTSRKRVFLHTLWPRDIDRWALHIHGVTSITLWPPQTGDRQTDIKS